MATNDYVNPNQMFPDYEFKPKGALAGYLMSVKLADYTDQMMRSNRDQDLNNLMQQNEYQNKLADNPVLASKRPLDIAKNQNELEPYTSGQQSKNTSAKVDAETMRHIAEMGSDQLKQYQQHAAVHLIGDNDVSSVDPSDTARQKQVYEDWRTDATSKGVRGIPSYSPQAVQELKKRGQLAANTIDYIKSFNIEGMKESGKERVARIQEGAGLAKEAMKGEQAKELAQTKREMDVAGVALSIYSKMEKILKGELPGETINPIDLAKARQAAAQQWPAYLHNNPKLETLSMKAVSENNYKPGIPRPASEELEHEKELMVSSAANEIKKAAQSMNIWSDKIQTPATKPNPANNGIPVSSLNAEQQAKIKTMVPGQKIPSGDGKTMFVLSPNNTLIPE